MTVIAQDPSVRIDGKILMATLCVPAEDVIPGPTGYRVQIIDYDSSKRRFNGAHTLPAAFEEEPKRWRDGDPAIVADLRFHAQNTYALIMKTLGRFEFALGRRVGWSFDTHQLKVAPHGMLDANAFYSHDDEGLVFGYFPGNKGQTVYTCLSHDVVVHETAHALIDALRERFLYPSSPDQGAFHEGLADVIALLSVFSQPELLRKLLLGQRTARSSAALVARSDVTAEALRESALFGLAKQMGQEIQGSRGEALRHSTTIRPDPKLLKLPEYQEAHRRGEILVAAVMTGFVDAWAARIERMGVPGQTHYAVGPVADEGADIAGLLATMWIRALDYMPPVHLEFPDALSAALTADLEVRPDDSKFDLRWRVRRAFKAYGIKPRTDRADGTWMPAPQDLSYARVRFESMKSDKDEIFRFMWENRNQLKVRSGAYTEVLSVRPCFRLGADGFTLRETVAEYYQVARLTPPEVRAKGIALPTKYLAQLRLEQSEAQRRKKARRTLDTEEAATREHLSGDLEQDERALTPLYGGGVLIFDEYGQLKYHVHNDLYGRRQAERLHYLWESGQLEAASGGARLRASRLSTIHRLRGTDARRFPAEGW